MCEPAEHAGGGGSSDSEPSVLADYILVLLEKELPEEELQQSVKDSLLELLKSETEGFVNRLFDALRRGVGEPGGAEAEMDDVVGVSSEQPLDRTAARDSDDEEDDDQEEDNYKRRRRPKRDEDGGDGEGGSGASAPDAKRQRHANVGGACAQQGAPTTTRMRAARHTGGADWRVQCGPPRGPMPAMMAPSMLHQPHPVCMMQQMTRPGFGRVCGGPMGQMGCPEPQHMREGGGLRPMGPRPGMMACVRPRGESGRGAQRNATQRAAGRMGGFL